MSKTLRNLCTVYLGTFLASLAARLSFTILDSMKGITYDNIAVSTGTLTDQLLSAFSAAQLFALMVGVIFAVTTYILSLKEVHKEFEDTNSTTPLNYCIYGLLTSLVSFINLALIVANVFSKVQVSAMLIKLKPNGSQALMALCLLLSLATLFMLLATLKDYLSAKHQDQLVITLVCYFVISFVAMLLAVFAFKSFNTLVLVPSSVSLKLVIGIVINIALACILQSQVKSK